MVQDLLRNP